MNRFKPTTFKYIALVSCIKNNCSNNSNVLQPAYNSAILIPARRTEPSARCRSQHMKQPPCLLTRCTRRLGSEREGSDLKKKKTELAAPLQCEWKHATTFRHHNTVQKQTRYVISTHTHSRLAQGYELDVTSFCVSLPAVSVTRRSFFVPGCKWSAS